MTFEEKVNEFKAFLKENLSADNVELMSTLDKKVDELVSTHKETEAKLTTTQDKLLEIVKGTSFKLEDEPKTPGEDTEKTLSVDEAFEDAFKGIVSQRNSKKEA